MKTSILICLVLTLTNCKPQNKEEKQTVEKIKHYEMQNKHEYNNLTNSEFEKFDINRFDKNKNESEDYVYFLNNGTRVREFGDKESGYFSQETPKNSLFTVSKGFYPNANIKHKGPSFKDTCEIGIWYEYDEKGKLISETDLDKPYKINFKDIIEFLKKNEADYNSYLSVNRNYVEKTKKGTWELYYRGKYKENEGMLIVTIDDQSSEIEQVIKITGKHGEKEIIFKK
ncbi:hypothetical protein [Flavobacterium sp.]|uniref:hypothetical protein n=1 Tax=Flavobacterium sp. TaxID=239 RepID=UPI00286AE4BF|nr:hypothetical protein [Flavobacterium sp.]